MVADPFTAIGTTAAVFELGKVAWKLGSTLVKLYQDTKCVDGTVEKLAGEVKSLGNECDLVHAELEEVVKGTENGEGSSYDLDGRLWKCLGTKVQECTEAVQELSAIVDDIADRASGFIGQAQRQMRLNKNREILEKIRQRIRTHTDGLRTTLLVVNIKVAHLAPGYANRELSQKLDALQDMVDSLQRSMESAPRTSRSDTDATLVQCAREVITQGSTMYEASLAAPSILGGQGAANSNVRVAQWVGAIDALRRENPIPELSDTRSTLPSVFSGDGGYRSLTDATSAQHEMVERDTDDNLLDPDSDDDLALDLAKAALHTSAEAFETSAWLEADLLLQETLSLLQQLPKGQRGFCDTFDLQYKLAVCAYHTQKPADAEGALTSLLQQIPETDKQRRLVCEIAHLLSLLYIRMDQVKRAKASCEKALQARRRLLGKEDDATLSSIGVMVRIYQLLQSHTLAKVYLTMIPEARKSDILRSVDDSLGPDLDPFDDASLLARSHSRHSKRNASLERFSSLSSSRTSCDAAFGIGDSEASPSTLAPSLPALKDLGSANAQDDALTGNSLPLSDLSLDAQSRTGASESNVTESDEAMEDPFISKSDTLSAHSHSGSQAAKDEPPLGLSRKEILSGLMLKPKTALDKAICYESKEQVTALIHTHPKPSSGLRRIFKSSPSPLHYAALFGEVDAARQILELGTRLMEVTTHAMIFYTLGSPFHWAVLSRQAAVVDLFLTKRPEVLHTLAMCPDMSSDMYKWWCSCTISETEQSHGSHIPEEFIAMCKVLLKHGWRVNQGIASSSWTLLHYATFLGYEYDPHGMIASFLCERGADPMLAARDGNTPFGIAKRKSNHNLVQVFEDHIKSKK
ncbi:uncharacterized protein LTR77_004794 [Saxophila tyrrhenica]|uniref:Fungal N-terminal domain-containing protein n=1 Tax=Saxophila tyrrhenica TaxID=1690608 RepID=A0AAV9PE86_9PEZI|nr:hypothetical protein LTR77_004794 [Saxophila tyrrhenica]